MWSKHSAYGKEGQYALKQGIKVRLNHFRSFSMQLKQTTISQGKMMALFKGVLLFVFLLTAVF